MTHSFPSRIVATIAGLSVGATMLAACSGDPEVTPTPSPSVSDPASAVPVPSDPAQAWEDRGGTAPDPSAEGTTEVTSLEESLVADIPNSWGDYPPQVGTDALDDPGVLDVLGLWLAGVTADTEHSIVIMSQEREDPPLDAQEYYDANFSEADDPQLSLEHEVFTSAAGHEVLFVDINAESESPFAEESVFFVFTDTALVVGLLTSPGERDASFRDELRAVADSLTAP